MNLDISRSLSKALISSVSYLRLPILIFLAAAGWIIKMKVQFLAQEDMIDTSLTNNNQRKIFALR